MRPMFHTLTISNFCAYQCLACNYLFNNVGDVETVEKIPTGGTTFQSHSINKTHETILKPEQHNERWVNCE